MVGDNFPKANVGARMSRKMVALDDVEKLLREDAEVRGKQVDKTPEELDEWIDRIIEKLEQEGPPEDHWLVVEEDERLAREDERLVKEQEKESDDEPA